MRHVEANAMTLPELALMWPGGGYVRCIYTHQPMREERDAPSTVKAITARPYHGNGSATTPTPSSTMPPLPLHVPALRSSGREERDEWRGGQDNHKDDEAGTQQPRQQQGTADKEDN
jgi:hypothetical protein